MSALELSACTRLGDEQKVHELADDLLASVRESSDGTHALDEPAPPLVPCVRLFRRYLPFLAAVTAENLNMDFAAYDNDTPYLRLMLRADAQAASKIIRGGPAQGPSRLI